MSKIFKNIPVISLWIAALSICAHLIIPHDHHLTDSLISQEESCPVSNGQTGHHTGFPIHCHAFNNLASEKAATFFLREHFQSIDLYYDHFADSYVFDLQITPLSVSDIREPFPDSYLLELSLLRAPPSLS